MNQDSRGFIRRRIEWNLHFDPPQRTAELHTLIWNQLDTASEACLPGRKVQNCRCEPINAQPWVSIDQCENTERFLSENESREADGITADVQNTAAADLRFITNVLRVVVEITEKAVDDAKLSNAAGLD